MIFSVRDGVVHIDLTHQEKVLVHLASESERTAHGIIASTGMAYPAVYKAIAALQHEGLIHKERSQIKNFRNRHGTHVASHNGSWLWELTEDGKLLAGAIRERCLIESPGGDAR